MTSQGQRFRRRALRRGYKVDEVDDFLDRVEATLNGDRRGGGVTSAEVHDVVFRVRFGGYDEWQVDLHLDRVERQLAEMAERGPAAAPALGAPDRRAVTAGDRPAPRELRPAPADRFGPPPEERYPEDRYADRGFGQEGRFGGGDRFGPPDRMGPPPGRLDERNTGSMPPVRDDRETGIIPSLRDERPPAPPRPAAPPVPPGPGYGGGYVADPRFDDLRGDGVGYNDPTRDAPYDDQQRRFEEPPGRPPVPPRYEEPRYDEPRYDDVPRAGGGYPGFEPGRHGKTDMTTEIRMPADISAPVAPALGGDAGRVDQLRRTFQPRRFGSGYDPAQVDRLFEGIVNAMAGRTGGQITDADLDPGQFNLVPGGYFEAEVDQALREVRDLIRNRR